MLGTHAALVCHLASFPGGDRGCLQLLPGLSDWEAIPGSRESISWPRAGSLRACLYVFAILLLCWLVKGKSKKTWLEPESDPAKGFSQCELTRNPAVFFDLWAITGSQEGLRKCQDFLIFQLSHSGHQLHFS